VFAQLTVPFVDVCAEKLTWALTPAATRPLAAISVTVDGAALRLAVLGASHQVEARLPGAPPCVESVTCHGSGLTPLPGAAERDLGPLHYRFSSLVEPLDEDAFTARVRALRLRLASDPRALVASFPGHPDALTGLVAQGNPRGVAWRTWHAYPLTGELVRTSTRLAWR
jgi:hypothetical protein